MLPKVQATTPANGVPEIRTFENTGEIQKAVEEAVASEENTGVALAKLILGAVNDNSGGGGGGGDAGANYVKEIKRHKWLAALLSLVVGSGGMVGTFYALKARAENNSTAVESIKAEVKSTNLRIGENTEQIRLIKVDVSDINTSVAQVKTQNTDISNNIKELKQENVDRLEKENAKLEREIRRLENNR